MDGLRHKVYIGIDVHHEEHTVAIMSHPTSSLSQINWKELTLFNIKNSATDFERLDTEIRKYILRPDEAAIAVDHTGGHFSEPIVYFLRGRGYDVYHLETKAVKAARERLLDEQSKSDQVDARGAAYLLYLRGVHGSSFRISALTPELGSKASVLNSLVIQLQQYNKQVIQCTNRLHQLLLAVFPEGEVKYFKKLLRIAPHYPTPQYILASQGLKGIKFISKADRETILALASQTVGVPGDTYQELIRDLSQQRIEALAKRQAIAKLIEKEVTASPYGPVLLSFPYFGAIAAASVIAIFKDINRWPDKKKFKKALGVYSTLKQSGASTGKGRMGREGSRLGRLALFQVVFRCIRYPKNENDFNDYYLSQVARGKPRFKAVVATMGKLAEIIYHCVSKKEFYVYQMKYRQ